MRLRDARFGHAPSGDFVERIDHGAIFGADGLWRMFLTGSHVPNDAASTNIETIGVATSVDLFTWVKHPGPLTHADPRWYEKLGDTSWPEEAGLSGTPAHETPSSGMFAQP